MLHSLLWNKPRPQRELLPCGRNHTHCSAKYLNLVTPGASGMAPYPLKGFWVGGEQKKKWLNQEDNLSTAYVLALMLPASKSGSDVQIQGMSISSLQESIRRVTLFCFILQFDFVASSLKRTDIGSLMIWGTLCPCYAEITHSHLELAPLLNGRSFSELQTALWINTTVHHWQDVESLQPEQVVNGLLNCS